MHRIGRVAGGPPNAIDDELMSAFRQGLREPGDLRVGLPTVFELLVNLKTAQAFGITLPQSVLAQATETIQ